MRALGAFILICIFLITVAAYISVGERQHAVNFCAWSVGSGIEDRLGRGLTNEEESRVEEICEIWYGAWRNGDPMTEELFD